MTTTTKGLLLLRPHELLLLSLSHHGILLLFVGSCLVALWNTIIMACVHSGFLFVRFVSPGGNSPRASATDATRDNARFQRVATDPTNPYSLFPIPQCPTCDGESMGTKTP